MPWVVEEMNDWDVEEILSEVAALEDIRSEEMYFEEA